MRRASKKQLEKPRTRANKHVDSEALLQARHFRAERAWKILQSQNLNYFNCSLDIKAHEGIAHKKPPGFFRQSTVHQN